MLEPCLWPIWMQTLLQSRIWLTSLPFSVTSNFHFETEFNWLKHQLEDNIKAITLCMVWSLGNDITLGPAWQMKIMCKTEYKSIVCLYTRYAALCSVWPWGTAWRETIDNIMIYLCQLLFYWDIFLLESHLTWTEQGNKRVQADICEWLEWKFYPP